MEAIVLKDFGGTENFELQTALKINEPGEQQVLVKIYASGFNPIDYQMRKGGPERARLHSRILGREFSGVVEKTGTGVTNFKIGDEIFAASGSMGSNGTYAQYILVPESILAVKPDRLSFQEAAAIPVAYLTALQVYDRLQINKSESILIAGGAGGVGLALIKLLIAAGHARLIATAGSPESHDILIDTGLLTQQIVNYKQDDLIDKLRTANAGEDFDYCVDLVGAAISEVGAEALKLNGTYADVTALSTEKARSSLFNKGATVINISNYAYSLYHQYDWYGKNLKRIADMIDVGVIKAPPVRVFKGLSIESVTEAHHILEENGTLGHKLVMSVIDK